MTREQVLDIARAEIGYTEGPRSNECKFNTLYYGQVVYDGLWDTTFPWCCVFIWWLFRAADMSDQFNDGYRTASCPTLAGWFKTKGRFVTSNYRAGDIVFFDFGVGGYGYDHVGIIEKVNDDGTYDCIEGNTWFDDTGSQSNGGAVARRTRTLLTMKLCDNNYLRGQGGPKDEDGRPTDMDLSMDMLRMLVILDRAGNFDD